MDSLYKRIKDGSFDERDKRLAEHAEDLFSVCKSFEHLFMNSDINIGNVAGRQFPDLFVSMRIVLANIEAK